MVDARERETRLFFPPTMSGIELSWTTFGSGEVPVHFHDALHLMIADGPMTVTRGVRREVVPSRTLTVLANGEAHVCSAEAGSRVKTILCDDEIVDGVASALGRPRVPPVFDSCSVPGSDVAEAFERAHDAIVDGVSPATRWSHLHVVLARVLDHAVVEDRTRKSPVSSTRAALERACAHLAATLGEPFSSASLLAVTGLERSYFSRTFKRVYGISPREYQTILRINRAKRWLREGKSAGVVADELGFADASHLTKQFKRFVGVSPRAFMMASRSTSGGAGSPFPPGALDRS